MDKQTKDKKKRKKRTNEKHKTVFQWHPAFYAGIQIEFEEENGILKNVVFHGGCNGNLKGIASLCEGKPVTEIIVRLEGIRCGFKPTSCPDQLAKALKQYKAEN